MAAWARAAAVGGGLLAAAWLVFPGALRRRPRGCVGDARFWAEQALRVARSGGFARSSGVHLSLSLSDVAADGELRACVRIDRALQDAAQTMHPGAAALLADELTTASIVSQRCYPGVSLLLSVSRAADCTPGSVVHVTSRILRQGKKLVHTEAVFRAGPGADAALLFVCSHVKYCEPPSLFWLPLLWLRTSIAKMLVTTFGGDSAAAMPEPKGCAAVETSEMAPNMRGFERAMLPALVPDKAELTVVGPPCSCAPLPGNPPLCSSHSLYAFLASCPSHQRHSRRETQRTHGGD